MKAWVRRLLVFGLLVQTACVQTSQIKEFKPSERIAPFDIFLANQQLYGSQTLTYLALDGKGGLIIGYKPAENSFDDLKNISLDTLDGEDILRLHLALSAAVSRSRMMPPPLDAAHVSFREMDFNATEFEDVRRYLASQQINPAGFGLCWSAIVIVYISSGDEKKIMTLKRQLKTLGLNPKVIC